MNDEFATSSPAPLGDLKAPPVALLYQGLPAAGFQSSQTSFPLVTFLEQSANFQPFNIECEIKLCKQTVSQPRRNIKLNFKVG